VRSEESRSDRDRNRDVTHVVHVGRRSTCSSETLPPHAVTRIQEALRSSPWYSDRWSRREIRTVARDVLREEAPGGLVLIRESTRVTVPAPFEQFFEPAELGAGDQQLRTLSGEADTREERVKRWVIVAGLLLIPTIALPILFLLFQRGLFRQIVYALLFLAFLAGLVALLSQIPSAFQRWYLVPGGVVVRRRSRHPGRRTRLLLRNENVAVFRMIQAGQVPVRVLEIWTPEGKRYRRAVSDRDAASFLAAWQSRLTPPTEAQLAEALP